MQPPSEQQLAELEEALATYGRSYDAYRGACEDRGKTEDDLRLSLLHCDSNGMALAMVALERVPPLLAELRRLRRIESAARAVLEEYCDDRPKPYSASMWELGVVFGRWGGEEAMGG